MIALLDIVDFTLSLPVDTPFVLAESIYSINHLSKYCDAKYHQKIMVTEQVGNTFLTENYKDRNDTVYQQLIGL